MIWLFLCRDNKMNLFYESIEYEITVIFVVIVILKVVL